MRMKHWFLALVASVCLFACMKGCEPEPVSPGPDGGTGGAVAVGGAAPVADGGLDVGGATGSGGHVATGGAATGGGSAVVIEWPDCADQARKANKAELDKYRKLLGPKYPMKAHPRASYMIVDNLPDVFWLPLAPTLSQRRGSCTANGALQARISQPWTWTGTLDAELLQDLADSIYSGATKRDPFPGAWPPIDTGSNGASALAEMKDRGLVSGWVSVTSFDELQRRLVNGPCILGANWYTGEFTPDRCGAVSLTGVPEGGHEFALKGIRHATKQILGINSWGDEYGAKLRGQGGFFWLKFGDVQRLLNEGGEIECLQVAPANDNAQRATGS